MRSEIIYKQQIFDILYIFKDLFMNPDHHFVRLMIKTIIEFIIFKIMSLSP